MARKPIDQLSPAYRRRIERAMQKGKSRQEARGHKAREHVARKEREIEERGLTSAQERTIFIWAEKRAFDIHDADIEGLEVVEWARDVGYDQFKVYRNTWDAARRQYKRDLKSGSWASRGLGYLEYLTSQAGAPDISWLYYH